MTDTKTPKASKYKKDLANNPCVRRWVNELIKQAEERDPVDALNDIILVKNYCELRLQEIQEYYK